MTSLLALEDFETAAKRGAAGDGQAPSSADLAATEQTAYERGYAAGWDDAVKAELDTQAHVSAEMARNLQDLGFTFHEARIHVLRSIEPFLDELLKTFLPRLAHHAIPAMVQDILMPLAESQSDTPIDLTVPVGAAALISPFVASVNAAPVRIVEEPSLTDGQAILRSGTVETRIDLGEAIVRITKACDDLFAQTQRSETDGQPREPQSNFI